VFLLDVFLVVWLGLLKCALIDIDQGALDEDDGKRKSYWGKGIFFFYKFGQCVGR